MTPGAKCIVKGCENRRGEGHFTFIICAPCHSMLIKGEAYFGNTFIHKLQEQANEAHNFKAAVRNFLKETPAS